MFDSFLIDNFGFSFINAKTNKSSTIAYYDLSCMLELEEDKYLFWSGTRKKFCIGERREFIKAKKVISFYWEVIEIPVEFVSEEQLVIFVNCILGHR